MPLYETLPYETLFEAHVIEFLTLFLGIEPTSKVQAAKFETPYIECVVKFMQKFCS